MSDATFVRHAHPPFVIVEEVDAAGKTVSVQVEGRSGTFSSVKKAREWIDAEVQRLKREIEMPALPVERDEEQPRTRRRL